MVATKAYKVVESAQSAAAWSHVTLLASATVNLSQQATDHVENLGVWHSNKTAFARAMRALRTFHAFGALARYTATNPEQAESTQDIVLALMEDGLASPGAAAWAMTRLTRSPQAYQAARFYYAAYGANRHTLWNRRNQSLAAWKATRDPPAGSPQLTRAPSPPPTWLHQRQTTAANSLPLPESAAGSEAATPKSAHPRSLPGASGWALPMSESTSKYVDLAARPRQTRSTSASGAGKPLEGQSDPGMLRTAPRPVKAAAPKGKKKAAASKN